MRKSLILAAMLAVGVAGCATTNNPENAMATAEDMNPQAVIDVPGITKDEIFDATNRYIAETFNSAKAVIDYTDKPSGTIIGNASFSYPCVGAMECIGKGGFYVMAKIKVEAKDGKFRLSFSNEQLGIPAPVAIYSKRDADAAKQRFDETAKSLKAYIETRKAAGSW